MVKIKKILLSLLLVISFLFISGFTTLAENGTIAQTQQYPDFIQKVGYFNHYTHPQNVNTYEYTVYYFLDDVYLYDDFEVNEYFLITSHNITLRKGLNRNTNSYELERMYIETEPFNGTWIEIRITLLKSFVNDNYPDNIAPFFLNNSALYIIYTPIDYEEVYNEGYNDGYSAGRDDGYNDGYDVGYNDGYNYGHRDGYDEGHRDGYYDGREVGYNEGYNAGREDGYNRGYEDGLKDVNVTDYFGERNMVKVPGINNAESPPDFVDGLADLTVTFNYGLSGENITAYPNIVLDKPYMILIIDKVYYDSIAVTFDDGVVRYGDVHATRFEIGDFDIYVFNFMDRLNKKYYLQIIKYDINNYQGYYFYYYNIVDTLYFSHASKPLNNEHILKFYEFGYLTGLEEIIEDNEAYQIGYENGYERGYYYGNEEGYDRGYQEGYDTGYDRGYTIGNNEGYERGFENGYGQGFNEGKTVDYDDGYKDGYKQGNEDGYNRGVKDGYKQGSYDTFLNDVAKWFGPMVLIVLIAGAYITLRNRRSDD